MDERALNLRCAMRRFLKTFTSTFNVWFITNFKYRRQVNKLTLDQICCGEYLFLNYSAQKMINHIIRLNEFHERKCSASFNRFITVWNCSPKL